MNELVKSYPEGMSEMHRVMQMPLRPVSLHHREAYQGHETEGLDWQVQSLSCTSLSPTQSHRGRKGQSWLGKVQT